MARQRRIVIPGQAMHIVAALAGPSACGTCASMHIARGNNRQATFYAEEDYCKYQETLFEYAKEHACQIHAYVLMTNHIHLLLTPQTETSVSLLMQAVGRKYVRYINGTYRRSGTLWEGRYKSAIIDTDLYLLTCSRYIELNPVRAGMVDGPGDYRWSSYQHNALGRKVKEQITPHALYMALGNIATQRQEAYRELFRTHIDLEAIDLIRNNTQQGTVIGGSRFYEEIEQMLKRRVVKHTYGGDRKSENFNRVRVSRDLRLPQ